MIIPKINIKDYKDYESTVQQIKTCCAGMELHLKGRTVTYQRDGKQQTFQDIPEGLGIIIPKENEKGTSYVCLAAEGLLFSTIFFCPFCGEKIE